MNAPWLHVIGISGAGVDDLPAASRALVDAAGEVIGPARAVAFLAAAGRRATEWRAPFDAMVEQVLSRRGTPTVILATGDPSWFGIGASLGAHLGPDEFEILPAPSAFSLAAARLNWPLQDVACLSAHGRPVSALVPHVQPGARILALTEGISTVETVATLLTERGYGASRMVVLNEMGAPAESRSAFTAAEFTGEGIAEFNTLAIECRAEPATPLHPAIPGLPDDAFAHDGQLTKREVRATTLARLAPAPGAVLWDVGAGCGSISIEWMRAAHAARAVAIERDAARRRLIAENAERLGTPALIVSDRPAPEGFADYQRPDALFLGAGAGNEALFDACWRALGPGGRFVANVVTLAGENALFGRQRAHGGELVRIRVERLATVGSQPAFRPAMTVTQWAATKGGQG